MQGALEIGPVSRALEGQPEDLRTAAANSIREALTPFAKGDAVLLPASVWIVTAQGVVTQDRHVSATNSPDDSPTLVESGRRRMRTSSSSDARI